MHLGSRLSLYLQVLQLLRMGARGASLYWGFASGGEPRFESTAVMVSRRESCWRLGSVDRGNITESKPLGCGAGRRGRASCCDLVGNLDVGVEAAAFPSCSIIHPIPSPTPSPPAATLVFNLLVVSRAASHVCHRSSPSLVVVLVSSTAGPGSSRHLPSYVSPSILWEAGTCRYRVRSSSGAITNSRSTNTEPPSSSRRQMR